MSHSFAPPPSAPIIRFLLIPVLGDTQEIRKVKANVSRLTEWLRQNINEYFDEHYERVNVLYSGEYRDMFIGETSAINGRHIRNIRATAIYRNNFLSNNPGTEPESLPPISGPAILFPDYQIWK